MRILVQPSHILGSIALPPSKSMAHRLLICAALASGPSVIAGLDPSQDISATCKALSVLGAQVAFSHGTARVQGPGGSPANWQFPCAAPCGESGSTLRFLIPLFALSGQQATLTGAVRLFQRPLTVYEDLFSQQGLSFSAQPNAVQLRGPLQAGHFTLPGNVSSQFISGLLFALPLLEKDSRLSILPPFESRDYVALTQVAQARFGVHSHWEDDHTLCIPGGQRYQPTTATVEGDWSQAGVPAVLGAVKGPVRLENLDAASQQGDRVVLDILRRCGAVVAQESTCVTVAPPPGGLCTPGVIDLAPCPDLGPILCTLALFCQGETQMIHAGRLRIKESDRIATMQSELAKMGGQIASTHDTITVQGGRALHTATTLSHNDHRVVMALTVAAACAGVPLQIDEAEAVAKSWPGFFADMRRLGIQTEEL